MKTTRAKQNGIHYTPPELAAFLAKEIWGRIQGPQDGTLDVLDPACGDGGLLAAFVESAPASIRPRINLFGYETDSRALDAAQRRLKRLPVQSLNFCDADFLSAEGVFPRPTQRSLFSEAAPDASVRTFDAIIANPPYVRTQVLGAKRAQQLARVFGLEGRVDLSYAFAKGMGSLLRPGGALGLLTSNRFMTIRSGAALRRLFAEDFDLQKVYDLGDTKLFEAAVLPAIIVAKRRSARTAAEIACPFHRIYEHRSSVGNDSPEKSESLLVALQDDSVHGFVEVRGGVYRIERGRLASEGDNVWALSTAESSEWLSLVRRNQSCRFDDVSHIRVGVKSTADEVFIRENWNSVAERERPEEELIHPLLTHRDVGRWVASPNPLTRSIVYPHLSDKDGKRKTIGLEDFPRAAAYFRSFEKRLRRRRYVTDAGRQWYEVWVPHNPRDWRKPKIVFPDISEQPRFFLDTSGALVSGECYWITLRRSVDRRWLPLMLAVANSSFIERFYDVAFHNKLYAGRRRFQTQYVREFPLPDLECDASRRIVDAVGSVVRNGVADSCVERRINALVWRAFGLQEEAVG